MTTIANPAVAHPTPAPASQKREGYSFTYQELDCVFAWAHACGIPDDELFHVVIDKWNQAMKH
jgi:hypothetical protein